MLPVSALSRLGCALAAITFALFGLNGPAVAADAARAVCASLALVKIPDTVVTPSFIASTEEFLAVVAKPRQIPALPICRVVLTITPAPGAAIGSEVWLPAQENWNKKVLGMGSGGAAGVIELMYLADGIVPGYVVAHSDSGSHAHDMFDMSFGRNPELAANRAYRGTHLTAVAIKQLVQNYYAEKPKASLFMGCSAGGYEGLAEIQRYPDDYDGVLVGNPALNWEKVGLWQGWSYALSHRDPAARIPPEKIPLIYKAAIAKCDALDGVADGVIDDPRRCKVDFKTLQCKGADGADCFTAPQVDVLAKLYAPFLHPRTKEMLTPGYNFGAENTTAARARLSGENKGSTVTADSPGPLVWSLPQGFSANDWLTFDFDKGSDAAIKAYAPYANTDPDMRKFKERGGKVIMYTGWADPNLHPETLINYYEHMTKAVGGKAEAKSFARLFMVPGLQHCLGGAGPIVFGQPLTDPFDAKTDAGNNIFLALERWVIDGIAPERIVARKYVDDDVKKGVLRTRPLCAYPKAAKWTGKGSSDDAANFTCADPKN